MILTLLSCSLAAFAAAKAPPAGSGLRDARSTTAGPAPADGCARPAVLEGKVLYGDDDRIDAYRAQAPLRALAASTAGLFYARSVSVEEEGRSLRLATRPYGPTLGLCAEEPFWDQRAGPFCSAFLVGPDLALTAGHCVTHQLSCEEIYVVFDFAAGRDGDPGPQSVPAASAYRCRKLLQRVFENKGVDYSLLRLDRPVTGRSPLCLDRDGGPRAGEPLFVIGHPAGLPTKVAGGARVLDDSPPGHFVADLDTYGGSSGSAVFNAATGLVEGILVRGEDDFEERGGCRVSRRCVEGSGCRGEEVSRASAVAPWGPSQGTLKEALEESYSGLLELLGGSLP